jgi:hypothetical protein
MPFTLLVSFAPWVLVLGGVAAISWLLARLVRPAPVVGAPMSGLLKGVSVLGFLVGVLLLATGAGVWWAQAWDIGTRGLLVVTGLALVLKPLRDVPWAAFGGLLIGGLCAGLVYVYFPLPETVFNISSLWLYLAIFLIPAFFAYLVFKFAEDVIKLIGWILASRPVATILGLACIIQGILLLLGQSLFTILFS